MNGRGNDPTTGRGQSEVVGSLLLVAVGVVLVAVVAVFGIGFASNATQESVSVAVQSDVSHQHVTVEHAAGDPLPTAETVVVLRTRTDSTRVPLTAMQPVSGGDDDLFTAGEAYRIPHGVSTGELRVLVVQEAREAVVHDRTYRLSDGLVSRLVDFESGTLSSFESNQDRHGTVSVADDGRTIRMEGNNWKRIDFDYTVTADTVVTFEFKSDSQGDIHGLGFENDNGQTSSRILRVYGEQGWGINVSNRGHGPYYADGDGWVRYTIPVGEIYASEGHLGDASSLVFVNDCDPGGPAGCDSTPDAESRFRNVQVYERED